MEKIIYVTKPFLPPIDEFLESIQKIWESKWLTNNGEYHQRFEKELADFLGVKYISLFSNGTLALITALQSLKITSEVITTPFSFVATTHALWWNNIKPVFADIEEKTYTLNPDKIEAAITPLTTAIMPVHVYGFPCNVYKIQKIADTYGLKVIYDAAHTFGARLKGESICNYGDLSILSFHATKVFTTFEGGAIICHDEKTKLRIDYLKNFGFADEITVVAPGINAKMNEFQAALGLLQLKYINQNIEKRKKISDYYIKSLQEIEEITLPPKIPDLMPNYAYFPILIDSKKSGLSRDELYSLLKKNGIYSRRYFYPLISSFPTYRNLSSAEPDNLMQAEKVAQQVLCLPIYPDLQIENIDLIVKIIKSSY